MGGAIISNDLCVCISHRNESKDMEVGEMMKKIRFILAVVIGLTLVHGIAMGQEVHKTYYQSGQLLSETTFKDDKKEG